MPKLKTHRGAAKRFSFTASGKIKRNQQGVRHILTKMTRKRKRQLHKRAYVSAADAPRIRQMLPNG